MIHTIAYIAHVSIRLREGMFLSFNVMDAENKLKNYFNIHEQSIYLDFLFLKYTSLTIYLVNIVDMEMKFLGVSQ